MTNSDVPLTIKVWGDLACFTRPEMKVERVSYPVMTPSAARGILEAVFWKPEFRWRVQEIWILRPIRYTSILRNEVNSRQSDRAARGCKISAGLMFVRETGKRLHHLLARSFPVPHDPILKVRAVCNVEML